MADKFSLDDLCWQVMDSDIADRAKAAEQVVALVPDKNLREALLQTMPKYMSVKYSQERRAYAFPPPIEGVPGEVGDQSDRERAKQIHRIRSARSPKVAAIRSGWRKALGCRLWCGPRTGDKLVRDCSYEDLMMAARQRRKTAKRMNAVAERIEQVAEAVRKHDVLFVADLSEDVLQELFGENPEEFEG